MTPFVPFERSTGVGQMIDIPLARFAIGDVVGQPMLAHKATHEGKLAAEVASGAKKEWVARVIPSVRACEGGQRQQAAASWNSF